MSSFKVINEYQFKVKVAEAETKREELSLPDFQRIVDENRAAEYIFVLLKQPKKEATNNCLLLLRKEFVSSFSEEDGLIVAGETLCQNWGYYYFENDVCHHMPYDWRFRFNRNGDVPVEEFIKNCLNEIRQALNHKVLRFEVLSFSNFC